MFLEFGCPYITLPAIQLKQLFVFDSPVGHQYGLILPHEEARSANQFWGIYGGPKF